ncbi:hypothetical protein [Salinigranum sp. GCM10025319]|uniref:hypothetical protein n=1 Tax=Salinigranum sp. GCM10025319 TaxID=3252687 RepID=UPI003618FE18
MEAPPMEIEETEIEKTEIEKTEDDEPEAEASEEDGEDDEDDAGDDLILDPEIVTTTRAAGIDDDAVALLSALRVNHAARDEKDGDCG